MRTQVLMLLVLPAAAGCLPEKEVAVRAPAAEAVPHRTEHVVVSSLVMVGSGPSNDAERAALPRSVAAPTSDPVFFHLGAGYGAIGQVDLAPCHNRGLDTGYVRVRVTFGGAGTVVGATVESLTQPSPEALACIAERVEGASVPTFQGGDVTLSKSIFVAPAGQGPEFFVNGDVTRNVAIAP
jgi:hypothetical protein